MLNGVVLAIATLAAALGTLLVIMLVAWWASRWPGRAFQALMLLIVTASIGAIVFSNRVLTLVSEGFINEPGGASEQEVSIAAKSLLVAVIGLSIALCAAWWFSLRKNPRVVFRMQASGHAAPVDLVLSFMASYVAFSILPIALGQRFFFHVSLIYPFFVFLALLFWVQVSSVDPVVVVKQCLSLLVFGSLAAAVVAPAFALQPGYPGLIPGFSWRLWGVAANANTLGSVACALFVMELAEPSERAWLRRSILVGAAVTLILSQSKTSILATMLGASVIIVWRLAQLIGAEIRISKARTSATALTLTTAACLMVASAGAWLLFADDLLPASLMRNLNSRAVNDLTTVTGRTWIWEVAIKAGEENLLFGQGAGMWELQNRLRLGLSGAVHAHNLFLQAFSRSGLVGLASLLVLLYFLLRYSLRAAKPTRGGSIALMTMFLMRSISEVPLQPNAILGAEFFAMMGLVFYVMDRGAKLRTKTKPVRQNRPIPGLQDTLQNRPMPHS